MFHRFFAGTCACAFGSSNRTKSHCCVCSAAKENSAGAGVLREFIKCESPGSAAPQVLLLNERFSYQCGVAVAESVDANPSNYHKTTVEKGSLPPGNVNTSESLCDQQ